MVRNTKGGKKSRKTKGIKEDDALNYKTDGQEYGQVIKLLGNNRLEVYCFDGTKRICNIRGKMRKRVYINKDDIVIVSLRDFQDAKGDIVEKYSESHKRTLIDQKIIPKIDFNNMSKLKEIKVEEIEEPESNGYYWTKSDKSDEDNIDLDDI